MGYLRLARELERMGFARSDAEKIANGLSLGTKYCNVSVHTAYPTNNPGWVGGSFPILGANDELGAGASTCDLTLTSGPLNPGAGGEVLRLPDFQSAAPVTISNVLVGIQNADGTQQFYSFFTSMLEVDGVYSMTGTDGGFSTNVQRVGTDLSLTGNKVFSAAGGIFYASVIVRTVKPT